MKAENERFVQAKEIAFRPGSSDDEVREMFAAFLGTLLLFPTITRLEGPYGETTVSADQDIVFPTATGSNGQRALPAFTDEERVHRYSPDSPYWMGLEAPTLIREALDGDYDELIVDPEPDGDFLRLDRGLLELLAAGELPL